MQLGEFFAILEQAAETNPDFELSDETEIRFTTYSEISEHGLKTKSWEIEEVTINPGCIHLIGGPPTRKIKENIK